MPLKRLLFDQVDYAGDPKTAVWRINDRGTDLNETQGHKKKKKKREKTIKRCKRVFLVKNKKKYFRRHTRGISWRRIEQ